MRVDTFKKRFGAKVKHYRENAGLSQEQLAEKIDVETSTIAKLETGINFPNAKTIVNLINFFGMEPGELFNFGVGKIVLQSENELLKKVLDELYDYDDAKLEYIYKIIKYLNEDGLYNSDGEKFEYFYKMIKYLNENK